MRSGGQEVVAAGQQRPQVEAGMSDSGGATSQGSYADRVEARTRHLRDQIIEQTGLFRPDIGLLGLADAVLRAAYEARTNSFRQTAVEQLREAADVFSSAILRSSFAGLASQCCHHRVEGLCWKCDLGLDCDP
jgi:hypothetical protein